MKWYLVTGAVCLLLGIVIGVEVGRRSGATIPPTAVSVSMPDAGMATARVEVAPSSDHASVTCRSEPSPPIRQKPTIVYLKGDPVQIECPDQPACPVLVCEGTASTRQGGSIARADTPILPPAVVTLVPREELRKWGIGPALGLNEELEFRPGLGGAWQPIPELELHVNVVWTGKGKIPLASTADLLYRF